MFAYYSWKAHIEPKLPQGTLNRDVTMVQNAVVEAQLMFYRKLNEFFRPPNPRFPDDLKCGLFGYPSAGTFMSPQEVEELHKRVAHPTTQQAVRGKMAYEMYDLSHSALEKVLPFLAFLTEHFHSKGSVASEGLLVGISGLGKLWDEWSSAIEPARRKALTV